MTKSLRRLMILLFMLSAASTNVRSQILPTEGQKLNYRIIGFSFPASSNSNKYKVEIAYGNFVTENSFKNNISKTVYSDTNKIIIEVPLFGRSYTWRVTASMDAFQNQKNSKFHHFSIGTTASTDTNKIRLRIKKEALKYKDAYIFLDDNCALYDMKGKPVWYLPIIDNVNNEKNEAVRDLKISPFGTITFIIKENIYEVDYNGNILWAGPGNNRSVNFNNKYPHYHHQMNKLHNGNYMVLGEEYFRWHRDSTNKSISFTNIQNSQQGNKISFGTIIEYDKRGKIVWFWRSYNYYKKAPSNLSDVQPGKNFDFSTHENAFFFDEKNEFIYVSFKNSNQILKVKYPEGKVIAAYGDNYYHTANTSATGKYFCQQHSCNISKSNDLYLFNNNHCFPGAKPEVLIFRQPKSNKGHLKKLWEYQYPVDFPIAGISNIDQQNSFLFRRPTSGGNVIELPDKSIFTSLCEPYADIFIINRKKELIWDAIAEQLDKNTNHWIPSPQYRASIMSHEQLEQLIWNQEIKSK